MAIACNKYEKWGKVILYFQFQIIEETLIRTQYAAPLKASCDAPDSLFNYILEFYLIETL